MALVTYLHRHPKTGVYWFRRAIPADLRPVIGKREFLLSVGTKDPREAKRRVGPVAQAADDQLQAWRPGETGPVRSAERHTNGSPRLSTADAERIATRYLTEQLAENARRARTDATVWTAADVEQARKSYQSTLQALRNALAQRDWGPAASLAEGVLEMYGIPRPPDEDLPPLYHGLVRSLIECTEAELRHLSGDWPSLLSSTAAEATPDAASVGGLPAGQRKAGLTEGHAGHPLPPTNVTLGELLRLYCAEKKPRPKVKDEMQALVTRFSEVCGADVPVGKLSKVMVREFKTAMLAKPRSLSQRDAALPLPELVAKFADADVERVTAVTVGKAVALLSALAQWGMDNDHLATNPFSRMKPSAVAVEVTHRRGFKPEELELIFRSTIYTGHVSARRWNEPGSRIVKDARFWLPLLGCYSGCRLEELGQAHVADVRSHDGILALNVDNSDQEASAAGERSRPKEGGGKSVKNASSKRLMPIHPVLLAAGFADYVEELRVRQEKYLFPDLKPDRYGHRTAAFSKWMARYLDRLGLTSRALVFHSFRHGFKSACRRADLQTEVHDYLTGHSNGDVGRRYGEEHLPRIAAAIAQVSFPTVDRRFACSATEPASASDPQN